MDGNMGFNFLLLGQKSDLQLMGRMAAEPWNVKAERRSGDARRKSGFLVRFKRLYETRREPRVAPNACCGET
jgi:hypothetical protein